MTAGRIVVCCSDRSGTEPAMLVVPKLAGVAVFGAFGATEAIGANRVARSAVPEVVVCAGERNFIAVALLSVSVCAANLKFVAPASAPLMSRVWSTSPASTAAAQGYGLVDR